MTTIALSGPTLVKAGVGVSAVMTASAGGEVDDFITQAESLVNCATRYNWTDVYTSGLNADVKYILEQVVSDIAAIYCVTYDMAGYTSRIEAEDIINVLRDAALRGIQILRDIKTQTFMIGA